MKHPQSSLLTAVTLSVALFSISFVAAHAVEAPVDSSNPPEPLRLTAEQDHQRMMDLLDIKEIRRGADGNNAQSPYYANYDETKAIAKTPIPDALVLKNGQPVTTPEMWWNQRRPEIVEDFDCEMYGRVPANAPKVTWEVTSTTQGMNGSYPIITKQVVGHVDNSTYPLISVNIQLTLSTPSNAAGPVPVIMQFSAGGGFGGSGPTRGPAAGPAAPPPTFNQSEAATIDKALKAALASQDASAKEILDAHPGAPLIASAAVSALPAGVRGGAPGGGAPSWQQQLLAKGWGYATLNTGSIQADNGAGLTSSGVIALANKGQRKPDDWGVLRAWAWGASRALDYFESDHAVNAKQVGLEGHSRWGKATVVAMAYDQRFAIAYVSSSGEGGAKIWRHLVGETVGNLAGNGEYHWMAGNFIKYDGPLTVDDLPVDAHELVAMCAPRPVFISGGANGDAWQDPRGMFMAASAAGPVYKLLGKKDLGTTEMPGVQVPLIDGDIAFREHEQGHTDVPNWPTFITFASRYLSAQPTPAK